MPMPETSRHILELVLEEFPDFIFIFSNQGEYLHLFGGSNTPIQLDASERVGKTVYDVFPSEVAKLLHGLIKEALEKQTTLCVENRFTREMLLLPKEAGLGDHAWFQGIVKPLSLTHQGNPTVMITIRNVTERKDKEERYRTLSETDDLTQALNRRAFFTRMDTLLTQFKETGQPLSLLMLDIDFFKSINDELGHLSGDVVICHVVELCRQFVRDVDCIGRIGGEEFAIAFTGIEIDIVMSIAERIRGAIEHTPCEIDNYSVDVTVSMGVTQVRSLDASCRSLVSEADKAMYFSKRNGRNRVTRYDEHRVAEQFKNFNKAKIHDKKNR